MADYGAQARAYCALRITSPARASLVGQPHPAAATVARKVLIGLEAGGANAVRGELLVALLRLAGDADGADHFAVGGADLQTAAFGKDLVTAGAQEIAHEDRLLLCALLHELRGATHGERCVRLAVGHLETDHGAAVFLPECLYLAARLDHDHGKRAAIQDRAAFKNGGNDPVGLIEREGGHCHLRFALALYHCRARSRQRCLRLLLATPRPRERGCTPHVSRNDTNHRLAIGAIPSSHQHY